MNKTKVKKTQGPTRGQQSISSFFCKKSQKDLSSTKESLTGTSGPQIKDSKTQFEINSPSSRGIFNELENLPPSPDLILSVPETPNSQIRLDTSPTREKNDLNPKPVKERTDLLLSTQLSPICRNPRSKDQRSSKRENRLSGSLKRLFSPPQDSNGAKKSRTADLSPSEGALSSTSLKVVKSPTPQQTTSQHPDEADFDQQKAGDPCAFTLRVREPNAPTITAALEIEQREKDTTKMKAKDGDGDLNTKSKKQKTEATENPAMPSACPVEEGFDENWFTEQMDCDGKEEESKKTPKLPDHVILSGGPNNRYFVLNVEETPSSKTLLISCSRTLQPTETCLLTDGWESTPVRRGDVVHLEGPADDGTWSVNRERGFLVLSPDSLVSGTSVSSSIRCMRRAVLGDMFKSFDGGSKQMLNGTMVHEVFQRAATSKDFSSEKLAILADEALQNPRYLGDMYTLGVSQEEMKQELFDYLPSLELWAKEYLGSSPKAVALKSGASSRRSDVSVTLAELSDIEENVWSPRFGLKGKIDVTAQVRIHKHGSGRESVPEEKTLPLELKTGRESNSIEHRSQVILYTLMSMERYDPEAGLLLYLKTGNMHPVAASHMDRRELLKLRNTLVHHVHNCVERKADGSRLSKLPEILRNRQPCRFCPQKKNCALYERAADPGSPDVNDDAVREFLREETNHLTAAQLKYFSHWLLVCCLEALTMESRNSRRRVWLQSPEESEKQGSCVGNLRLVAPVTAPSEGVFLHRFQRGDAPRHGLPNGGLASGDRVVVSDRDGRLVGLATGYLGDVGSTSVTCKLDRDLSKFAEVSFRVDADEGAVGFSSHLTNLSRLMENGGDSARLRELIVDLRPPEFISNLSSVLPRDAKDTVANILKGLNKPQKQAMKKVLLSKDYTLIVGMPGTGKTTTICTLVRILHACGFSVLLTGYTHSAVDNILLKLKRFRVGFLRLGLAQKVHPDIMSYTEESVRKNGVHTLSELESLYHKELVVATTCMGIKHPIFTRRRFDFCIVDEASQISQPICLGPLFYAERFVLVGDHQQLPPIVQNQEARSLGMDESLFKRLEYHSEAVVQLAVQYRMNRPIMSLSNSLMYEGRLECGSEKTATALLSLPALSSVRSELDAYAQAHPRCDLSWLLTTLMPGNPVCFLDCSAVPALETVEQGGISNHTEASLVHTLVSLLIKAGCKPGDVGIIAPYRQQLKTISSLLQSPAFTGIEVNTVDRYQGRDKSLIVLSFVRSTTEAGNLGELLKDWRRLNVAITRAKHKLLMVGSAGTLRRYPPVEKLLKHLQQENMIVQLPPDAHNTLPKVDL